jgi:hypothetical protein
MAEPDGEDPQASDPHQHGGFLMSGDAVRKMAMIATVCALVIGILGVILYSIAVEPHLTVLASALLFCCAAGAAGGLTGFIFGIPHAPKTDANGKERAGWNTSLEQISDWLTKILIGATLVQLTHIPSAAAKLFGAMAPSLGNKDYSAAFAGAIVIYFSIWGFLVAWIGTTLYLYQAMRDNPDA